MDCFGLVFFLLFLSPILAFSFQNGISPVSSFAVLTEGSTPELVNLDDTGFGISNLVKDINGDGVPDVITGAFTDNDGSPSAGAIWVTFFNSDLTPQRSQRISNTNLISLGETLSPGQEFGNCLVDLGTDPMGRPLIAVGSFLDDLGAGSFYIIGLNSTSGEPLTVRRYAPGINAELNGIQSNANFAFSCEGLGDFDGNGAYDLIVGAPLQLSRGAVFAILLQTNGDILSVTEISDLASPALSGMVPPAASFGSAVFPIGDLNGDGIADLSVGARFHPGGGVTRGAAYVLFLQPGFEVQSAVLLTDSSPNGPILANQAGFGSALSMILRPNGLELLVGAAFDDGATALDTGALYLLLLSPNASIISVQRISELEVGGLLVADHQFGSSVSNSGDLNNDGVIDMVIGAPRNGDTGAVFITLLEICGDSVITGTETCDDANAISGDGCNSDCLTEAFYTCSGLPSICTGICGDGVLEGGNLCDDGNSLPGDGCSETCVPEEGYVCLSSPSVCETVCGDGIRAGTEECDDGNDSNGDGCTSNCQSTLSDGALAGILVAIFLLFICCIVAGAAAAILAYRKSQDMFTQTELMTLQSQNIPILTDIKVGIILGSGQFGNVYKGSWQGTDVALKSLKGQGVDEFSNEMGLLASLRHPHIISFYGLFNREGENFMVTEFMNKGDLLSLLQSEGEITVQHLMNFTQQIVQGMTYLHSENIIHRDLACRNILVCGESIETYLVKIADFGLSRKVDEIYTSSSKTLPVRWTAPEAIEHHKFTSKSDIWSFGVVLWEIFSRGSIPYPGQSNQQVFESVKNGYRLSPPREAPEPLIDIFASCWYQDPENRPTFESLGHQLSLNPKKWQDFKPPLTHHRRFTEIRDKMNSRSNFIYSSKDMNEPAEGVATYHTTPQNELSTPYEAFTDPNGKSTQSLQTTKDLRIQQLEELLREKDLEIKKLKEDLFESRHFSNDNH